MEDKNEIVRTSEVLIKVGLNAENIPVHMEWKAEGSNGMIPSKGLLLSLFDYDTRDTVKIDLWTKDMQVEEMDRFVFQTLRGLCDTYFKATQNNELASAMQQFTDYFGQKTEIIKQA